MKITLLAAKTDPSPEAFAAAQLPQEFVHISRAGIQERNFPYVLLLLEPASAMGGFMTAASDPASWKQQKKGKWVPGDSGKIRLSGNLTLLLFLSKAEVASAAFLSCQWRKSGKQTCNTGTEKKPRPAESAEMIRHVSMALLSFVIIIKEVKIK